MKSNKEFLEGVYKKAEQTDRASNPYEKKMHLHFNLKTAVAAALVIAFIPLSIRTYEAINSNSEDVGLLENSVKIAQEREPEKSNEATTESLSNDNLENMISLSSLIALGEITSVDEDTIYIKVLDSIKGEAYEETISIHKAEDIPDSSSGEVLVFLKEGDTSDYLFTENAKSYFYLYTIIDSSKVFKSLEGLEISLEELDNLINGG